MVETEFRTLDLQAAADFLHMSTSALREKAKSGVIKGAKPAKKWVFLESDLVDHLQSLYPQSRQALQVTQPEGSLCHYTNATKSGGYGLPRQTAKEYNGLLKRATKQAHRNSTTG